MLKKIGLRMLKIENLQLRTIFSIILILIFSSLWLFSIQLFAFNVFSPDDIFKIKTCTNARISPDGKWSAYTVRVERQPEDEPGSAYSELYLVSAETVETRPFITGKVNISSPQWSPDGSKIAFLSNRWNSKGTQVWIIAVDGGEAVQLTHSETSVSDFRWHPVGKADRLPGYNSKKQKRERIREEGVRLFLLRRKSQTSQSLPD